MKLKLSRNTILYSFTIIFFALFYYFLPFAGDDWAWGSDIGLERLYSAFDGYNGRYLGNLLIILITRSVVAKLILCTAVMFLLIFILSKIFDELSGKTNSTTNYVIAFSSVLVLVLPNQIAFGELQPFQIFGSTIGWLSGFTNYVVPSALILVYYYFVISKKSGSMGTYLMLALVGVTACLCVEHYTLFCLAFSFTAIVYRYYKAKKLCKVSASFFAGSLVGAGIMFTNSSYISMQKGDVSTNQRAVGFIGSLKKYASYIFPKNASKTLVVLFEIVLLVLIVSFLIFFAVKAYKAFRAGDFSKTLPIMCMVVMTAPLLFTNSGKEIYVVAPRCYFLQYFMLVIYLYTRFEGKINNSKWTKKGASIALAILIAVTGALYCHLDYMGIVRDKTVNEAMKNNSETVEIVEYPKSAEHIQWASNFIKDKTYLERYKLFKSIPDNTKTVIVDK